MRLEDGKTYLTAGGYIVTIIENEYGEFCSNKPNPGVNSCGSSCSKYNNEKYGWVWEHDGTIGGLTPEWTEKLRIVREFDLPEIPEGYEFADEYPMCRTVKEGEYAYGEGLTCVSPVIGQSFLSYIALKKKKETTEVYPKYYKRANGRPFFNGNGSQYIRREQNKPKCFIHSDGKEVDYADWNENNDENVKDGLWIEVPESEVKEWLESHKEPAKEPVKESPIHIPFSGAGQYRLANGQIVNLQENQVCKQSDKVLNAKGVTTIWRWNKNGTIDGLGFGDHSHLYLVEKIVEEKEKVWPKYYSRGDNIIVCKTSKYKYDQYYSACTPCFDVSWDNHDDDEVKDSFVKEITEEEFWKRAKTLNYPPDPVRYGKEVSVAETAKETPKELPKHIPFSGAGQYRLANGQIVNLDQDQECKCSDGILDLYGDESNWIWEKDGTISGLYFDDHSHLYLTEKIVEEKEEVWPKYYKDNGGQVIYRKSKDVYDKFYKNLTADFNSKCYYGSIDEDVINGYLTEITEEEFWKRAMACRLVLQSIPYDPVRYGKEVSVAETKCNTKEPLVDWKESLKSYIQSKPNHFYDMSNFYVTPPTPQKENQMTPETAKKIATSAASTAAKYGFKAANYFMIEPVVNIAKPILRSFRYAVCVGTLVTGFYAYHNPDVVTNTIKSCLPKVTVESPEIFRS
jgi:hypothetical protein